jgi:hypothetical protein
MNIKELRIGSFLRYKVSKNPVEVLGMQLKDNSVEIKGATGVSNSYFEPIPLNEDWLLNLGFDLVEELKDSTTEYSMGDFFILFTGGKYVLSNYFNRKSSLNYVHELQNLYFSITGSELEQKK